MSVDWDQVFAMVRDPDVAALVPPAKYHFEWVALDSSDAAKECAAFMNTSDIGQAIKRLAADEARRIQTEMMLFGSGGGWGLGSDEVAREVLRDRQRRHARRWARILRRRRRRAAATSAT